MLKIDDLDDVTDDTDALSDLLESPDPLADADVFTADPDPAYASPSLEDRLFGGGAEKDKPAAAGRRVTTAVRKDIRGKVAMLLTLAGGAWSARDPHCGGVLLEAIPDRETPDGPADGIATAIADLVCDSPDLIKWFTTSGRYLKWFTLAMAVQPVLQAAFAHHISHTVTEDGQAPPDWAHYGAG